MAISFARLTIHTRSKGHSAIAAAAYRAGIELYDERTGQIYDFSNRKDVQYAEILLPKNANEQFADRSYLWNQAEAAEKRKDSQVAKELTVALPKELSLDDQKELARRFAHDNFVKHGLVVDMAIHDKGDGNAHAHLLISTRRLEGNAFSLKKARDLNPVFYGKERKTVYDFWNDKWRDFQNGFFAEKQLDLKVDAEFLVATRHQGRIRKPKAGHYLLEENELRKEASFEQVLSSPKSILEHLAERQATFTEQDIAGVVFKNTKSREDFDRILAKVKTHKELISLGIGEDGRDRFTTRQIYQSEQRLINDAITLSGRREKAISARTVQKVSKIYGLKEEQSDALLHLVQGGDIGCLVGRAGAGKTYTMKALKNVYDRKGYTVYGTALSGVAAKVLESETGIKSDTIHSLSYRINTGNFAPKPGSVIVVDEAGMVALKDMRRIVRYAKQNRCKVLLLGDPEQLQPILAGAPFRAITDHVGFAEMRDIQRQKDVLDRKASINLALGRAGLAIDHYDRKGSLHMLPGIEAKEEIVSAWLKKTQGQPSNGIMLAYTRKQVSELNMLAREYLIENNVLPRKSHTVQAQDKELQLAEGERILFLKNNYDLGVCNGDFATVQSIVGHKITAKLGDRTVSFNTKEYSDFGYGYAATVHKSQGTTFDNVFVYVDSHGWDRHLSYVAMTRHKEDLQIFANKRRYGEINHLISQLSRAPIRDNAIDYPISFAERRGFDPEKVLGKALNYLAGIGHKIRDGWRFVRNYEAWVITRERQTRIKADQSIRKEARRVAEFADISQTVNRGWSEVYREFSLPEASKHPRYRELEKLTKARDKLAHEIYAEHTKYESALAANHIKIVDLERYAERHIRREGVKAFIPAKAELKVVLNHPDWQKLSADKISNRLLKERINLLKEIRGKALEHQVDQGKMRHYIKAMRSIADKIENNRRQKLEFEKIAPKLAQRMQRDIRGLEKQYSVKRPMERDRAFGDS